MIWVILISILIVIFGSAIFFGAPYVPSRRRYIERAFETLYKVSEKDTVVDIGSGDGVVLRVAAAKGAQAIGYEINPVLVWVSRLLSAGDKSVKVRFANFWTAPLPNTTTLTYIFSVSRDNKRLIKKMQREADRLQRPLWLMCYGSPFSERKAEKSFEAYHLYVFNPLQPPKAQV